MGCGETLVVSTVGYIICADLTCPRSDAVADILDDSEGQHIVQLDETEFTVRHPLRERLGDELTSCDLSAWIAAQPEPPAWPGRYRVVWTGDPDTSTWSLVETVPMADPDDEGPF
jgi:hypothetical protein